MKDRGPFFVAMKFGQTSRISKKNNKNRLFYTALVVFCILCTNFGDCTTKYSTRS